MNLKKKMITLTLGFAFLIAGFGVSYDFTYGTFEVNSNEVKAVIKPGDPFKMNGRVIDGECKWRLINRTCNTVSY